MRNAPTATELSSLRPRRSFKLALVTFTVLLLIRLVFVLSRQPAHLDDAWPWWVLFTAHIFVIAAGFTLWLLPKAKDRMAGRVGKVDVALIASIGLVGAIGLIAPEIADPVVRDGCSFQHYDWHQYATRHRAEFRPWSTLWFPLPIAAGALIFEWVRDDLRSYLSRRTHRRGRFD